MENYASDRVSSQRFGVPNPLFLFVVKINKNFFDNCYRAMYNKFFLKSYCGLKSECKSVFKYQNNTHLLQSIPNHVRLLIFAYVFKRIALFRLRDKHVSTPYVLLCDMADSPGECLTIRDECLLLMHVNPLLCDVFFAGANLTMNGCFSESGRFYICRGRRW